LAATAISGAVAGSVWSGKPTRRPATATAIIRRVPCNAVGNGWGCLATISDRPNRSNAAALATGVSQVSQKMSQLSYRISPTVLRCSRPLTAARISNYNGTHPYRKRHCPLSRERTDSHLRANRQSPLRRAGRGNHPRHGSCIGAGASASGCTNSARTSSLTPLNSPRTCGNEPATQRRSDGGLAAIGGGSPTVDRRRKRNADWIFQSALPQTDRFQTAKSRKDRKMTDKPNPSQTQESGELGGKCREGPGEADLTRARQVETLTPSRRRATMEGAVGGVCF
jgi:hypothetical protein